ncbi:conserved hypothetical protein [Talaromyces stipitatus ATCC 10500]|uniref:MARVEL domain-containing protein n=1 Tax=Talaromyces stipitatus (strain ATCC 10500 / CBS 375.48 / QM 6759 / NRRL 1006) TaxID=441959 RepID=B8MQW8_TALSN|nr:uncharacterized protein TSTA_053210 [Talaromyces stipitatus ATCC 10500]EED12803.1 conserved hypothetical protein [Talaromyces stipitatus ATCC 10500]
MDIIPRSLLITIRLGQFAFSAIVAGMIGYFISLFDLNDAGFLLGRWIYVEILAGLSVILGLIFLLPAFLLFFIWPIDVVIALAWFAAFGLLFDALDGLVCGGVDGLGPVNDGGNCTVWETAEAFSFLSAFTWLITGFLGLYLVWRADEHGKRQWHQTYKV